MGIYSPGRRRLMVALLLTSVLLLAIDVQGNVFFDRGREGFQYALDPLQSGAEVVTRPVRNAWRGVTQYDDLRRENQELRDALEGVRADQITWRAAIADYEALLALNNLAGIADQPTIAARVLGESPINLREHVEIDRGTDDGIEIGMPVVSIGGLVGKVSRVAPRRSWVMLVTDPEYAVQVKVVCEPEPSELQQDAEQPRTAVPSEDVAPPPPTTAPPTTEPPADDPETDPEGTLDPEAEPEGDPDADGEVPATTEEGTEGDGGGGDGDDGGGDPEGDDAESLSEACESTGMLQGQGRGEGPTVGLTDERTQVGRFRRGDVILTHGVEPSLAPPDLPVGAVARVVRDSGSAGPTLHVELAAEPHNINFVQVVLYKPQAETSPEDVPDDPEGDPAADESSDG